MDEKQRQRPIRLFDLAYACSIYARVTGFDESYARFVKATSKPPDLALVKHRTELLVWLRKWGCRQFAVAYDKDASEEIRSWYDKYGDKLCPKDRNLCELSESEMSTIETAYESLSNRTASWYRLAGGATLRKKRVGPTGAAKILFAVRPRALLPWDSARRKCLGYGDSGASYMSYIGSIENLLEDLAVQCRRHGLELADLPRELGRPFSSVPKLIDEYYWVTITRGWRLPDLSTLQRWVKWGQV